ncbi:MAG: NAD(+) synthase [Gemmataceae bacterium]
MPRHGFFRVAAASPVLRVADCSFNAERTIETLVRAESEGCDLVVFPELGLTGYTCGDLFHQSALQSAAENALAEILTAAESRYHGLYLVGLPVVAKGKLFNVAAVCLGSEILSLVPKIHLPNYKEFYEQRHFSSGALLSDCSVDLAGQSVFLEGERALGFEGPSNAVLGVEICEDLWTAVPPSSRQALAGANVLCNLSASNETVGKHVYRRQLVVQQSARCLAGYVYAGSGVGESTQDLVFGGHCLIAENGVVLAESERFSRTDSFIVADLDLDRIRHERIQTTSFRDQSSSSERYISLPVTLRENESSDLRRDIDAHPFVPSDPNTRDERCREVFSIQVAGLAKRLEQIGKPAVSIGVSGGLDSTLALLVLIKTADLIGMPRRHIHTLTLPGFGTTRSTLGNARKLMEYFGTTVREIDIRPLCIEQMRALGHSPFGVSLDGETPESLHNTLRNLPADKRHDLVFENVQARVRTMLLMNSGFTVGTGDMSELALGWCTYNADHMNMYNPNVSVPKTLVRFLVRWVADHEFDADVRTLLHAVAETVISPELLPTTPTGEIAQATEDTVGPYELHDFFLYHFLRYGTPPEKILFLAARAKFDKPHSPAEIRRWLGVFLKRFFANQYKRSCLPDGPKVGSVSLSPRGDWRMPSDASAQAWLDNLA